MDNNTTFYKFGMNISFYNDLDNDNDNDKVNDNYSLASNDFLQYPFFCHKFDKRDLNDNTNEKSTSFLEKKTIREESDLDEYLIKNEDIAVKKIEIKGDNIKKDKTKRGRKTKTGNNKEEHTKDSDDNKMCKIKTFFGNNFQDFINLILKNTKLNKLSTIINNNLKKDYNLELWDKSLKDIYLETKISSKYRYADPNNNINIIKKIYEEENEEIIKFLDLTYGEIFEIFIRDINSMNSALQKKIENSEILDNSKFLTIYDFLNKIRKEENKGESDEFIEKYIEDIIRLSLNFKQWFMAKNGRERK